MQFRPAAETDCALLARLNHQLIQDEDHPNPMTVPELEERMRQWLAGDYRAVIFEAEGEVIAYALYQENETDIYLRQFFVVRHRRREGLGRQAMHILFDNIWPKNKRLTVEVLSHNRPAVQFWKSVGYEEHSLSLEIPPRYRGRSSI